MKYFLLNQLFSGCLWLFAPKFWQVMGTYELSFCSTRSTASVVLTMRGRRDTQILLDGKKLNFMHSELEGMLKLSNVP